MRPWQNQRDFKHTLPWGVLYFVGAAVTRAFADLAAAGAGPRSTPPTLSIQRSGHESFCRFSDGRGRREVHAFNFKHTAYARLGSA